MGSALHRLEIILVGVVLLLSGGVVTALLLLRPVFPAERQATAAPIVLAPRTIPDIRRPSVVAALDPRSGCARMPAHQRESLMARVAASAGDARPGARPVAPGQPATAAR